jgi:hypothetical protein
MARDYVWIATGGGAWSLAANWDDVTDGIDPSQTVPGPQDSVTVSGASGSSVMTLTGQGDVLSADFSGNSIITGSLDIATLTLGDSLSGGLFDVGGGGEVTAGSFTAGSGSVIASGPNSRIDAGTLVLGAGQSGSGAAAADLDATSGGAIQLASLVLDAGSAALYADGNSSIEVGTLGGAALGALTVDAGATLSGQGDANAYGNVVNNGTIAATGGELMTGNLTGTGLLSIGAGAILDLNGRTGAGQAVQFAGAQGTLALAMELNAPQGTITGFAPGDAIDELGSPISAATYVQTKAGLGVLTLWYGNQVAGTLTLVGAYGKDVFLTASDGAGGTLVTVEPDSGGGGGGASGGTTTPDQYLWKPAGGGAWNTATNWQDITAGQNPAQIAPGVNDLVTIAIAQGANFAVITGPANAATLEITGDVGLGGAYAIGALTIGITGAPGTPGLLDLLPGASMTADSAAIADGGISISGSALLEVSGALTLGGGASGVGLPVTALSATAGGTITAASLTMGGGSGDSVTTDPTGVIEIGTAGHAAAGAVTVDAGASLTGNGSVNPFGAVVDNGTITASGGLLTLGSVTGGGQLAIATESGLQLNAGTALPIAFADATGVLAVADERVALTGLISNFAPGDIIDILNDPITGFTTTSTGGNTEVTLYYGNTAVDQLLLAGTYTVHSHFLLLPDGNNGTDLMVAQGGGSGGGGGQGTSDTLAWAKPGSGSWGKTGNWWDVTTNSAALAPPGAENPVELIGATGTYQVIGGPGICAAMACYGDTLLYADFTTGSLTVGGTLNGTVTAGSLDVGPTSGATATTASVDGGSLLVDGSGTTLSVAGTVTLGVVNDGTLALSNHGTAQLGGLVLGGVAASTVTADATSSVEIGLLRSGASGAVTVDPGYAITGYGVVNPDAAVVDNGTITAQGGTLWLGAVSGTGALSIGGEATLALTQGDAVPIDFTAGGGTLELDGSEETPSGVIAGFAPGDLIVTGSSTVGSIAYTPGAGDIGTLTLYSGGQVAGTLLLAGNFSGETFTLTPDGAGSAIGLQAQNGGPSQGTTTPDDYVWTGAAGTLWNTAANWSDITAGQTSADIAPGSQDLDTITGATGNAFTTIVGPANAASLTLFNNIALSGIYSIGQLNVGQDGAAGVLALGGGSDITAAATAVQGGLLAQAAVLATAGTLSLQSGLLQATDESNIQAGALLLEGSGSILTVDATSVLEIGVAGGAQAGEVTVDPGAVVAGAGAVNPLGAVADQGTITASAGTLILGSVSGSGLLEVGVNADLTLAAGAAASLLIDFAGPGTLTAAAALPLAAITGFGDSDSIVLPISGVTSAVYAQTGANIGVLTLSGANGATLGQLTLAGVGDGQTFTATATQGGTVLTTQTTTWGGGGSTVGNNQPTSGNGSFGIVQDFTWWSSLPSEVQAALATYEEQAGSQECYVWTSPDGTGWGPAEGGFANFAVAQNPVPDSWINLPAGYEALLAQGVYPATLTDNGQGGSLIMGNAGNDTIVAIGGGDTLVGGAGGNDVIYAANAAAGTVIYGGGNDTIVAGNGPAKIQTSLGGHSLVFLGANANVAELGGSDMVVAGGGVGSNDTVTASGADTVFGPASGEITHIGGAGADLLVAGAGTFRAIGGSGNGGLFYAGASAFAQYIGGSGSEVVVGGSGVLSVQGGAGSITVFGGAGQAHIQGAPGPSQFVLGAGAATVSAAQGNDVWLAGAANDSLVASGGNIILWGAGATGNNVFQAGNGPVTMHGGLGNDTFVGGSGAATITGGGGADIFSFTDGLTGAGAYDQITDFNTGHDTIELHGYSGYTSGVVNGSEVLTLSDGTRVQLNGITSLTGVHISVG